MVLPGTKEGNSKGGNVGSKAEGGPRFRNGPSWEVYTAINQYRKTPWSSWENLWFPVNFPLNQSIESTSKRHLVGKKLEFSPEMDGSFFASSVEQSSKALVDDCMRLYLSKPHIDVAQHTGACHGLSNDIRICFAHSCQPIYGKTDGFEHWTLLN